MYNSALDNGGLKALIQVLEEGNVLFNKYVKTGCLGYAWS